MMAVMLMVMPISINGLSNETVDVGQLIDGFAHWLSATMTGIVINSCEQGILSRNLSGPILQSSNILISVQWYHSIIVVGSCDQHCRVFSVLDSVQGRIFNLVVIAAIVTGSILGDPSMSNGEVLESKHISDRYLANDCAEQVFPLVCYRCHEKSTV
jgi:hypothetical protein